MYSSSFRSELRSLKSGALAIILLLEQIWAEFKALVAAHPCTWRNWGISKGEILELNRANWVLVSRGVRWCFSVDEFLEFSPLLWLNKRRRVDIGTNELKLRVGDELDVYNGGVFVLLKDSDTVLNNESHGLGNELTPAWKSLDGEIAFLAERRIRSTLLVHINIKGKLNGSSLLLAHEHPQIKASSLTLFLRQHSLKTSPCWLPNVDSLWERGGPEAEENC